MNEQISLGFVIIRKNSKGDRKYYDHYCRYKNSFQWTKVKSKFSANFTDARLFETRESAESYIDHLRYSGAFSKKDKVYSCEVIVTNPLS